MIRPTILNFLRRCRKKVSFVMGSRHLGHQDWRYRRHGTARWAGYLIDCGAWVYTQIFNRLYNVKLTDPCTMYKVFVRRSLEGIHLQSNGFELDWEILAKLIRKQVYPVEFPFPTPRAISRKARKFGSGATARKR